MSINSRYICSNYYCYEIKAALTSATKFGQVVIKLLRTQVLPSRQQISLLIKEECVTTNVKPRQCPYWFTGKVWSKSVKLSRTHLYSINQTDTTDSVTYIDEIVRKPWTLQLEIIDIGTRSCIFENVFH
jgi:hypothetical protein